MSRGRWLVAFGCAARTRSFGPAVWLAALVVLLALSASEAPTPLASDDGAGEGKVPTAEAQIPAVDAVFLADSYAPGSVATLEIWSRAPNVTIQVLHSGPETQRTVGRSTMVGISMGPPRILGAVAAHEKVRVRVGRWESGLYFARLRSSDGRIGFAPFVVRPARPGRAHVAVVVPTQTWQAYNYRDENGDGVPDTWYADPRRTEVELFRPFLYRGVPPHFRNYDLGFLHWLAYTHRRVDFLSDADLDAVTSGDVLARRYRLIVFPGHEEYVTTHAYDIVERFRDEGGNLAFLSANNFFHRVTREGDDLYRTGTWRDLGRPEAALVGIQYVTWNQGRYANAPFRIVGAERARWLFEGTGLANGSRFGTFGIEIDGPTRDSPHGLQVLATIPNIFGRGQTATMTYYETAAGAKVFAAGAFTLGGDARWPVVSTLLENLWARLTRG